MDFVLDLGKSREDLPDRQTTMATALEKGETQQDAEMTEELYSSEEEVKYITYTLK